MWKCPVCDQENTAATVCPACGYDRTCDYEQHPTAFAVTNAKPTHTLRREWREMQSSLAESAPQPARQAETQPVTVLLTLAEAAAGCRKTVSLKSGQDRVRLTLPIPAGVIYGEKLRYSLFNIHDGTRRDVIIKIRLCRSGRRAENVSGFGGLLRRFRGAHPDLRIGIQEKIRPQDTGGKRALQITPGNTTGIV